MGLRSRVSMPDRTIKPLGNHVHEYLRRHQLERKFQKTSKLFEHDMNRPSLNVEILEPKHLRVYSFRIDSKYRALFVVTGNEIEIISITNHYK